MSTVEINFHKYGKIRFPPTYFLGIKSINSMKEQFEQEFGIPKKDLEIYHGDKIVNDDKEFISLQEKASFLVIKSKSENIDDESDDPIDQGKTKEVCVIKHVFHGHKIGNNQFIWKDAIIPYVIDENVSNDLKIMIQNAISEFHTKTFIKWKDKTNDFQDYVMFVQNNQRSPHTQVGCCRKGKQEISLCHPTYPNVKSKLKVACILHEMMHTLGFIHEHQRNDRDKHITLEEKSLEDDNFVKDGVPLGQYDYKSLMHYGDGVGFKCNNNELSSSADKSLTFSQLDLAGIRRIYGKEIYKNVQRPHFGEWHKGCTSNKCTDKSCCCNACGQLPGGINCGYIGFKGHWTCCMNENENNLECHPSHTGFWHMACEDPKCTSELCYCKSCGGGCTYNGNKAHWSCCNKEEFDSECPSSPYLQ